MDDEAHVGLVDPHPEGDGGAHHPHLSYNIVFIYNYLTIESGPVSVSPCPESSRAGSCVSPQSGAQRDMASPSIHKTYLIILTGRLK